MKAIVISPHPDDETLGAGGTILKLISQGASVAWLNVTNMKVEYGYPEQTVQRRADEMERVRKATGYSAFYDLGLQPAALERYAKTDIIAKIREAFESEKPEVIFLPFPHDAHSDHKIVYECAISCAKAFRAPYVRKILCMDIISETNYAMAPLDANCYVDISPFIEKKLEVMKFYQSELLEPPFPRSKEALLAQARYRGSACYCAYAEAFQIIKEIII